MEQPGSSTVANDAFNNPHIGHFCPLRKGAKWEGFMLKAEIEVKGVLHPVLQARHQKISPDSSLTLRGSLRRR